MTEREKIAREIADFIVPGVPENPGSTFDAVVWDIAYSTALASITPPAAEGDAPPCPKCKGVDLEVSWHETGFDKWHHVLCNGCGHETNGESRAQAITAWNQRAALTPPAAEGDVTQADACAFDGKPCYVGKDTDDAHYRCGTSACKRTPPIKEPLTTEAADGALRALDDLQQAEATYRQRCGLFGPSNIKAVRALDWLRRSGEAARTALADCGGEWRDIATAPKDNPELRKVLGDALANPKGAI